MKTQLDATLTIVVACIAAGAVLLGAVIAATTAGRRQMRQLASETERLDKSLAAEGDRHALTLSVGAAAQQRQLAHDRQLVDVAELRALLDESAHALHRLERAVDAAVYVAQTAFKMQTAVDRMIASDATSASITEKLEQIRNQHRRADDARSLLSEVAAYRDRIAIRLSAHHVVGSSFQDALNELHTLLERLPRDLTRPLTTDEQTHVDERQLSYLVARDRFVRDAVTIVASQIEAPPSP